MVHRLAFTARFGLPGADWQYKPFPGRFNTQRCVYCGEVADTADHYPNLMYLASRNHRKLVENWLVDACHDCRGVATRSGERTFSKRHHAVLVALRLRLQHSRAKGGSGPRLLLMRRIQHATLVALDKRWKNA